MTPDAFWQLVERLGLPVAMLAVALFVLYRRWLVTRGELEDKQQESDNWRALYERERAERMAVAEGLVKTSSASVDVATAVRDALAEIARRDPYTERIEGTTRRGR